METITVSPHLTSQHAAAVKLAQAGFNILPLDGKRSQLKNWPDNATDDVEQVDQWWREDPRANIGARVFNGHVVVDIDPRNGGDITWAEMNRGHVIPETLTTLTGSGGHHFWFKLPFALPVRGKAGAGVDLKISTGYVVMPGSIHPETACPYIWQKWAQVAILPDHLLKRVYRARKRPSIRSKRSRGKAAGGLLSRLKRSTDGERNNILFWAACRAVEQRLPLEEELREAALALGLEIDEVDRTLESARYVVEES